MRAAKVLALAALAAASLPALAQGKPEESPRYGSFELSLSGYRPNIDAEFGGTATPWANSFGTGKGLMFRADVAKSLFTQMGTLDLGVGGGYFERYGHGFSSIDPTQPSPDSTGFRVIPTRLTLTYRFDLLAQRYRFPLVPYGRVSVDRYFWWVTNGRGSTANASGVAGSGATNGYSFSGGLALLLDFFDPTLARDMDRDTGINNTYLFVDFRKSTVKDFGSSSSWDLSDTSSVTISGGILFVF